MEEKRACVENEPNARTYTLESVNEIHIIGLYDKCRPRHRVKGKPSSRSSQMRKGMAPFAGCENEREE